jgi:alcohol dehydrogenase (cytochrome c)
LTNHGSYNSTRFVDLDQINVDNVKNLKMAFAVSLGGIEGTAWGVPSNQITPLVNNGKLYTTDPWGTPYKIDVSSGKKGFIEWVGDTGIEKDPEGPYLAANRGLALWGDLVITNLIDGRVMAFDDKTGEVVWDVKIATEQFEGFSGAPLAVKDKIIVGQSWGDWATRGWLAALDAKTGKEVWRFHTVPSPEEAGGDTWKCETTGNPDCWKSGGASLWVTGSYDPDTNALIYGTGNPWPSFDPEYRPGDNLYSDSTISVDVDTGKLNWHYQYTPGDMFDWDETGSQLLIDKEINGKMTKALVHFARNGFAYTLDRTNGKFIQGSQYTDELSWTKGIDSKTGKPLEYDPNLLIQVYAQGAGKRGTTIDKVCPYYLGGINFFPTAYNPKTGLAYGHSVEGCMEHTTKGVEGVYPVGGGYFTGGSFKDGANVHGSILAMDVSTGELVKKIKRRLPAYAGVMATPDLVWVGEMDGTFSAFDAKTLEEKWSFNVGSSIKAPAMSYSVDGKQYIAILGGSQGLFNFGHADVASIPSNNTLYVFSM